MSASLTPVGRAQHILAGDLVLVMPTDGEYQVVKAAVQGARGQVKLWRCGIGPDRAGAICVQLERGPRPQALALLGWAGGLVDDLGVGDIVIADEALSPGAGGAACVRLELRTLSRVRYGPLLTTEQVLRAPEAKRSAAMYGALAVEMEARPLAMWAAEHRVPFVHGRVILDTVDEALPELDRVLDDFGRLRIGRLLQAFAARPALLLEFVGFARRLRRANRRLADLARAVVIAAQSLDCERGPLAEGDR